MKQRKKVEEMKITDADRQLTAPTKKIVVIKNSRRRAEKLAAAKSFFDDLAEDTDQKNN